jgi:toxin ParE1/3/4
MKYNIVVTLAARQDTLDALNYYDAVRAGLGDEFLADLEERYEAICANPLAYSYTDSKNDIRNVILNRFPYLIIFRVQPPCVIALAIHNIHKKPINDF